MTAILIVVTSIVVGVLVSRFGQKRGSGKLARRLAGIVTGLLALLVLAAAFGPAPSPPARADGAAAAAASAPARTPGQPATTRRTPRYITVTAQSRAAAKAYIGRLDAALQHVLDVGPGISPKQAHDTSAHFSALRDEGESEFGAFGDPLGYCGMAGIDATVQWQAILSGGHTFQQAFHNIDEARSTYQEMRGYCLDAVKG